MEEQKKEENEMNEQQETGRKLRWVGKNFLNVKLTHKLATTICSSSQSNWAISNCKLVQFQGALSAATSGFQFCNWKPGKSQVNKKRKKKAETKSK